MSFGFQQRSKMLETCKGSMYLQCTVHTEDPLGFKDVRFRGLGCGLKEFRCQR